MLMNKTKISSDKNNAKPNLKFNIIKKRVKRLIGTVGWIGQAPTGRPKIAGDEVILTLLIYGGLRGINNNIKSIWRLGIQELNLKLSVYQNFNRQAQRLLPLVEQYLADLCLRSSSKIVIADSTPLPVCKYWRAYRYKVASSDVSFGYGTTLGKYLGFKMHLAVNKRQEIVNFKLTKANVYDGLVASELITPYTKTLIGDNHYGSVSLRRQLKSSGCLVVAPKRKNQINQSQPVNFKGIYKLRSLVETVFSVLKESFNLLTFRARSHTGYLLHYTLALLSYQYKKIYD